MSESEQIRALRAALLRIFEFKKDSGKEVAAMAFKLKEISELSYGKSLLYALNVLDKTRN